MKKKERLFDLKAYVHLWYLAEFFLEEEIFQTKFVVKIKTHFTFGNIFPKIYRFRGNMEISCRTSQATNDNKAHANSMLNT